MFCFCYSYFDKELINCWWAPIFKEKQSENEIIEEKCFFLYSVYCLFYNLLKIFLSLFTVLIHICSLLRSLNVKKRIALQCEHILFIGLLKQHFLYLNSEGLWRTVSQTDKRRNATLVVIQINLIFCLYMQLLIYLKKFTYCKYIFSLCHSV